MKRSLEEDRARFEELHCEFKSLNETSPRGQKSDEVLKEMETLSARLGFDERAVVAHAKGESEYWEGLDEFFKFEEALKNGKYD